LLNNLTTALTGLITSLYVHTGLAGILIAMAIESCCIPLPSEIVMPLAGIMIASGKLLPGTNPYVAIVLVALAGAVGCLIGSMAAYGIGYKGGRPLLLKYGRYVLISQHDADKADAFFQRWGNATAFFSRLLPVVRTYISLPAGIAEMPFVRFCIYSFLGSFPWCIVLAYVGYVLGGNLERLTPIFHSLDIVILVVLVVLVALYIWRHIRNDRMAREAHAAAEAAALEDANARKNPQAWNQQQASNAGAQNWNQQASQNQNWNQQQAPNQSWNQQPQNWGQQPPQAPQNPNQNWGQQPSPYDDDRTIRRG
jgi:membrane protein DedA with SNARE-associated domain